MSVRGFFITGTDTGVGKTALACALVRHHVARGLRVAGMKPVSAGCVMSAEGWLNDDADRLRQASNVDLPLALMNPYAFEPAIAPHIAAAQVGVTIDVAVIERAYAEIAARAEVVIVEGAGGWLVPLNAALTIADVARRLSLPVVLAVGMRLGCLNHALLTADAITRSGLTLAGWIANRIEGEMSAFEANLAALDARLGAPCWGVVPFLGAAPDPLKWEGFIRIPA